MRIKIDILVLLSWGLIAKSYSQVYDLDSVKIAFSNGRVPRIVRASDDLLYTISITNFSNRSVQAYEYLSCGLDSSIFDNFYYHLYKKKDKKYEKLESNITSGNRSIIFQEYHDKYGPKGGDSAITHYDCSKMNLSPGDSVILKYNVLKERIFLEKGEYRFKLFFRVAGHYHKDTRGLEAFQLEYRESRWYYFKVLADMDITKEKSLKGK